MKRPRVIPDERRPHCLALYAAMGLIAAFLIPIIIETLSGAIGSAMGARSTAGFLTPVILLLLSVLLPFVFLATFLASAGVRAGWASLALALCAMSFALGLPAYFFVRVPGALLELAGTSGFDLMLVGIVAAGIVYAIIIAVFTFAAMLGAYWLKRWAGRPVIRQTGLLCWSCAYNLGSDAITICPECSAPFDANGPTPSRVFHFFTTLRRAGKPLLIASVCLVLVAVVFRFAFVTWPMARFLLAVPKDASTRTSLIGHYHTHGSSTGWKVVKALRSTWAIPDAPDSPTGFVVQLVQDPSDSDPRAYVLRADFGSAAAASPPVPPVLQIVTEGTRVVRAALNKAQLELIIRARAVPPSLLDAIRSKADELGWAPRDIATPRTISDQADIDPTPHFPQSSP